MMAPTVVLRDGEIELGARQRRLQPDPLGDPADGGARGRAGDGRRRGGAGAAPALRAGRRPGRARDRRGGAGAARGARHAGRPPARDQPLLRRRPGGRPRPRDAARSAAAAIRAAAAASPTAIGEAGPRAIDFEAEGLLDGVEGEAREARLDAARASSPPKACRWRNCAKRSPPARLTLLPVERALAGDGRRYTPREIAEIVGRRPRARCSASAPRSASPTPIPTSAALTEADLEAARRMKAFLDAGLPEDGMLQVARTIGMGTARIAEANRELVVRTLMQPGDTERDLALRFAAAAEHMLPLFEPTLVYALQRPHARADPPRRDRRRRPRLGRDRRHRGARRLLRRPGRVHPPRRGDRARGAGLGRRPPRGDGERGRRAAGAAGEDDRRRGDAGLGRARSRCSTAALRPDRGRRGGRRRVPVPARRPRLRPDPGPVGRLLRPPGQPGQPHHRRRPARQRPRRRGDQGRRSATPSTTPSPASGG